MDIHSYSVKRIADKDVEENPNNYNVNNLYDNDQPEDYFLTSNAGNTNKWIEQFHSNNYHSIQIDKSDVAWMKEASKIGKITCKFPKSFEEELTDACQKYKIPEGSWFIRSDNVSLKNGMYGIGPYNSIEKIIKSIVTCIHGHTPLTEQTDKLTIYFMQWKNIDPFLEFRCFIYKGKITAVSDQHLYRPNLKLKEFTNEQIIEKVKILVDYFYKNVSSSLRELYNFGKYGPESYTIDIAILENGDSYFIESNPFGKEYPSGSSLFHWVNDEQILMNNDSHIEIRIVE